MKLEFNSQICTTVEQSKKLLELGLKPETSDMVLIKELAYDEVAHCTYDADTYMIRPIDYLEGEEHRGHIPAWSLHRLLYCLMPNSIKDYYLAIYSGYVVTYDSLCGSRYEVCKDFNESLNIYDNIIDCIEWLIKEDYFNKEYLKQ